MISRASEILSLPAGVFAHRGNSIDYPENTLPAFRSAFELGCDMVETDLHLTADGELVLWHDERTGRNAEQDLVIRDSTLAELRSLDAGFQFRPEQGFSFRGMGLYIMTIDELFEEFPAGVFNIDLKSEDLRIAEAYAAALSRHRAWERTITGSFHHRVITRFRRIAPACITSMSPREVRSALIGRKIGLGFAAPVQAALIRGKVFQVPEYHGRLQVVTRELAADWAKAGVPIQVWTVNEAEEAKRLIELGVRGIFTDRPREILAALKSYRG